MRELDCGLITEAVSEMCVAANCRLGDGVKAALARAEKLETNPLGRAVLRTLLENAALAEAENIPLCQDTGLAVVFLEVGQDIHLTGGNLEEAVNAGVARGYEAGCLRRSMVRDPLRRVNTGDNTPAVIHCRLTPGDRLKITVAPKGFGSENMGALALLTPAQGAEGLKKFVLDTLRTAGANPCPPVIVGVGAGGNMELAALLAKRALLRPLGERHPDPFWAGLEEELLTAINRLDIGPAGFGGRTTALAVHINPHPTHIAGLPVAVNLNCHAARHQTRLL
ncbi:MAG: fumarate hydratase [Candidatus Adiutrix sp.]|jgi:fumarate hydratase subunit alpha|nr:fumarate hydratase [Candidatus Adiutrix sp.]